MTYKRSGRCPSTDCSPPPTTNYYYTDSRHFPLRSRPLASPLPSLWSKRSLTDGQPGGVIRQRPALSHHLVVAFLGGAT